MKARKLLLYIILLSVASVLSILLFSTPSNYTPFDTSCYSDYTPYDDYRKLDWDGHPNFRLNWDCNLAFKKRMLSSDIDLCRRAGSVTLSYSTIPDVQVCELLTTARCVRIDLSYTKLHDATFQLLAQMPQLEYINFSGTDVSEETLTEIFCRCKNLRSVFLGDTNISASVIEQLFLHCKHLTHLSINGQAITDKSLETIVRVGTLKSLTLFCNDTVPKNISILANLTSLTFLGLGGKHIFTKDLSFIAHLHRLETIRFTNLPISDGVFDYLSNLTNLRLIELSQLKFSGSGFAKISALPALQCLVLDSCEISQEFCSTFRSMPELQELHFDSCTLSQSNIQHLAKLQHLRYLTVTKTNLIGKNALSRLTSKEICCIAECNFLLRCNLSANPISNDDLRILAQSHKFRRQLQSLDLSSTALDDTPPELYRSFSSLTFLNLQSTMISDTQYRSIQQALPKSVTILAPNWGKN